ncbi:MAG: 3-oxoacyl-ACP reductase FabG, partial [Chloroflexota bacterium]
GANVILLSLNNIPEFMKVKTIMNYDGQVVIVTGGASGIGRATVNAFAQHRAKVTIWDVQVEAGESFAAELRDSGTGAIFERVNVADSAEVDVAVANVVAQWGRVDVLVNNAGIVRDGQLVKYRDGAVQNMMSDDAFDKVIDVNLRGVFNCTRGVVPTMIEQQYGRILNASSVVGLYGNFGQTNYVAAKSGVIGMTKVWARELGKHGITVNAVAPGFIRTEMLDSVPDKIIDRMVAGTPVGRIGTPEDIASAYVFLASESASFISGTVLSVDGGMVLGT